MTESLIHLPSLAGCIAQIQDADKREYIEEQITIINHKLKFISKEVNPSVLILNKIMDDSTTISSIVKESISLCGGKSVESIADNPDILIILSEDSSFYGSLPDILFSYPFSELEAVKKNQIYIINHADFDKSSEDTILVNIEILAEIIQSKYFVFGRNGEDWVQFDIS